MTATLINVAYLIKRPTILDVAARAGVSKSLVSLALNGSPKVSQERRTAILAAAAELGYRGNSLARLLVSNRTRVCGVIVGDFHNPFYADILDGIVSAATAADFRVLAGAGLHSQVVNTAEWLLEFRVEGLFLLGVSLENSELEALTATTPVTVVAAGSDALAQGADTVTNDDYLGARMAVEHLASLGHRHIAHMAAPHTPAGLIRQAGYIDAMSDLGLRKNAQVYDAGPSEEDGYETAKEMIPSIGGITALFVFNDFAAAGVFGAIKEAGLSIPDDLSIVGYDNAHLAGTRYMSLTTINQPQQSMGELAVHALLERLDGTRAYPKKYVIAPDLIVRQSTRKR
jgi:DNA-binding LacI/PurR family transcriptional regulator